MEKDREGAQDKEDYGGSRRCRRIAREQTMEKDREGADDKEGQRGSR